MSSSTDACQSPEVNAVARLPGERKIVMTLLIGVLAVLAMTVVSTLTIGRYREQEALLAELH